MIMIMICALVFEDVYMGQPGELRPRLSPRNCTDKPKVQAPLSDLSLLLVFFVYVFKLGQARQVTQQQPICCSSASLAC